MEEFEQSLLPHGSRKGESFPAGPNPGEHLINRLRASSPTFEILVASNSLIYPQLFDLRFAHGVQTGQQLASQVGKRLRIQRRASSFSSSTTPMVQFLQ
jgi:hypothetical protein